MKSFTLASLANPFGQHWNSLNKDNVQEQILTGASKTGFVPTDLVKLFPNATGATLDFGCGIGRNADSIRGFFNSAYMVGYDLPGMLELMPLEVRAKYDKLTSDFDFVESVKPRTIFASLCFQHIPTFILSRYLEHMSRWPNLLYVATRWYNDADHDNVLNIITNFYRPVWLSEEAKDLERNSNPEIHWSGIFAPYLMSLPKMHMTTL